MVHKTFGEICDELTILRLKKKAVEFLGKRFRSENRFNELVRAYATVFDNAKTNQAVAIGNAFIELQETNQMIWNLEADIRGFKIEKVFSGDKYYIEIGKRAESIRKRVKNAQKKNRP